MRNLRYELELPGVTQRELFRFHEDPSALPRLSPPEKHVKVIEQPKVMKTGARVIFPVSPFGVPIRWVARMEVWETPVRFVDVQRKGPYREWVHEHRFADAEGGTLCEDEVTYRAPLGGLARRLLVDRKLRWIFNYRAERLLERFGGRT